MNLFFLNQVFWGNSIVDYFLCIATIIILFIIIKFADIFMRNYILRLITKVNPRLDSFVVQTLEKKLLPLLYYGAFYLAVSRLVLKPTISTIITFVGFALITFIGAAVFSSIFVYLLQLYWIKRGKDPAQDNALRLITKLLQILIWGLAIITLLDNYINIDALIAGLGIGGIAIGFAAQAVLQDVFSYFSIFLDKPFEVGDTIVIGEYTGTVEHIGLKTTRLRSINGEELIISNADLTNSRVRNYKSLEARRVVMKIGVTYNTGAQLLKEIPAIIKDIFQGISDITIDRVHFASFGDYSLVFEAVYYVNSSEYIKYMDIQQNINYQLKDEFEKRGISFAYPTQTIYISGETAEK